MKEKKRKFFMREFFFEQNKKTEDFFGKYKRDQRNKRSLCSQKNAWIEWKRMEKEEKKVCCAGCGFFFSARHNRIVKNVKNGRPFFKFFFSRKFFH